MEEEKRFQPTWEEQVEGLKARLAGLETENVILSLQNEKLLTRVAELEKVEPEV
jgi:regulator of replication initiation timing